MKKVVLFGVMFQCIDNAMFPFDLLLRRYNKIVTLLVDSWNAHAAI